MTGGLYRWPEAARFGRVVPKSKFYEQGTVPAAVREKFVSEVQRITWAYKLAENTINLPGTSAVPEIQVFQIDAKGRDVSGVRPRRDRQGREDTDHLRGQPGGGDCASYPHDRGAQGAEHRRGEARQLPLDGVVPARR